MGSLNPVDSVRAIGASFERGDIPAILTRRSSGVEREYDGAPAAALVRTPPRAGGGGEILRDLGDFARLQVEPQAFLADGRMAAVPIQVELVHKAGKSRVRDLEAHLWTFGAEGLVSRFRRLVDARRYAALAA